METPKQWFQDWTDACTYANECAPDFSAFAPSEPYSALGAIAVFVFLLWWWNDRRIKKLVAREARYASKSELPAGRKDGLSMVFEQLKAARPASAENRAA